jgi:alanine racemase
MTIKDVPEGEYIGYGTTYLANQDMKIAIVPVGYAYGYARSLSNQGRALIHGQRVGVVGMVNMNMLAVDVTSVQDVSHGDEVVLIGFQGDLRITVDSFGEMSSQLNYELLARLPHNIPRSIV